MFHIRQNASLNEPSDNAENPWRKSIPERGTDDRIGTASRGSNRDVASSGDHELRHDDDRVHKWQSGLEHPPADRSMSWLRIRSCEIQSQSVRFMIIVSDPLNLSQREVIKVTREVTETTPLICSPQAPVDMVLMKPLLPRPKKKPLMSAKLTNRTRKSSH